MTIVLDEPRVAKTTIHDDCDGDEAARALLLKAADAIRERGWVRGRMMDGDGRVCVLGALAVVDDARDPGGFYGTDYFSDTGSRALALLAAFLPGGFYLARQTVATWNDGSCKNDGHAIRTLERAAQTS